MVTTLTLPTPPSLSAGSSDVAGSLDSTDKPRNVGSVEKPEQLRLMNQLKQLAAFNSSALSDALDSLFIEGVLLGIKPLLPGQKMIGPAYTVKYQAYNTPPESFQNASNYIDQVPSGAVIVIDNEGREECTTWGEILSRVALMKSIHGTVIHGACRDVDAIRALHYPVFTKAVTMRSGKNRVYKASEQIVLNIGLVTIQPGDIIFGDDCGVLSIPHQHLDAIIQKANTIQRTEQRIIAAVQTGSLLEDARRHYHYDRPWLNE